MKALVTGAAGFIGSHLVDRLVLEGWEVDGIDDLSTGKLSNLSESRGSKNFKFTQCDICTQDLSSFISLRKPDYIFHLAAQSSVAVGQQDPYYDANVNILGTLNVLQAAKNVGVRKVLYAASGGTIYGEPKELPVTESAPLCPQSYYGLSKKVAFDYCCRFDEDYGLEFCALALANVYGPRQDPHGEAGVVAIFAQKMLLGEACKIFGDGYQTRDFVFVDDVVDAFIRAANRQTSNLINLGTGQEVSVNELFKLISAYCNYDSEPIMKKPRPGDIRRISLDPNRAFIQLGWKPFTPLEEGIAKVVGYLRSQLAGDDS